MSRSLSAFRHMRCLGAGIVLLTTVAGCGSSSKPTPMGPPRTAADVSIPGIQRATSAMSTLRNLRDQLIAERTQADKTLAALAEVMNGQGDLRQPFVNFTVAVGELAETHRRVATRTDDMRGGAREYITGWEVEVLGVEDADLRKQAEQRRNQVRANYTRINESLKSSREVYGRFETALNDLQRFLANDLTREGVNGATGSSQKTRDAGAALRTQIDASVAELDRVMGEMTPAGPVKTAPAQ